jgi:hypothetical protein
MNTRFIYFRRFGFLLTTFAVGFLLTNSAWGQVKGAPVERKAWNVEEMQALTNQLVTEMSAARQAIRREPRLQEAQRAGAPQPMRFMANIRQLEVASKQLASRVRDGGGYEKSLGIARKLGVLLRDSEVLARSLSLSESSLKDLKAAHRTLNKIAPYYGKAPLYPEVEAEVEDAGDA